MSANLTIAESPLPLFLRDNPTKVSYVIMVICIKQVNFRRGISWEKQKRWNSSVQCVWSRIKSVPNVLTVPEGLQEQHLKPFCLRPDPPGVPRCPSDVHPAVPRRPHAERGTASAALTSESLNAYEVGAAHAVRGQQRQS